MATLRDFDKDTRQYFYEKAWKEVIEEKLECASFRNSYCMSLKELCARK